jgi:hypothetical protein
MRDACSKLIEFRREAPPFAQHACKPIKEIQTRFYRSGTTAVGEWAQPVFSTITQLTQQSARKGPTVNFGGTVVDPKCADFAKDLLYRVIASDARAAENLQ